MSAPVLETERLILRGHRKGDLEDLFAMWGDPEVARFIGGKPSTLDECWSRLLRYVGRWSEMGFGFWAVTERATGRFMGDVGFADFKRALDPPFGDTPEMGWALGAWSHGKGYASEAVAAALEWGDATFGGGRVVCMINPANGSSIRVAEKAGFREYARTDFHGEIILFER